MYARWNRGITVLEVASNSSCLERDVKQTTCNNKKYSVSIPIPESVRSYKLCWTLQLVNTHTVKSELFASHKICSVFSNLSLKMQSLNGCSTFQPRSGLKKNANHKYKQTKIEFYAHCKTLSSLTTVETCGHFLHLIILVSSHILVASVTL